MSNSLIVYLNQQPCGQLSLNEHGNLLFQYDDNWVSQKKLLLSCSLPLTREVYDEKTCRPFFSGLLPEEDIKRLVAKSFGISANNTFELLNALGGECAGAVSFYPQDFLFDAKQYRYKPINSEKLALLLKGLPLKPLLTGEKDLRLSLAGVQQKMALFMDRGEYFLPLNGAPSSHILKPASPHFENLIENEWLCLHLAKQIGIDVAIAEMMTAGSQRYLLITRYDRAYSKDKKTFQRIHQEDFCQALGFNPNQKYQSEGGPNLKACFTLVRNVCQAPAKELQKLLDVVLFNIIIGNHDAHAKNFSLLIPSHPSIRLAPAYDLVATSYYPELTDKMAMKIGKEPQSLKVTAQDIEKFAAQCELNAKFVIKRFNELIDLTLNVLDAETYQAARTNYSKEPWTLRLASRSDSGFLDVPLKAFIDFTRQKYFNRYRFAIFW